MKASLPGPASSWKGHWFKSLLHTHPCHAAAFEGPQATLPTTTTFIKLSLQPQTTGYLLVDTTEHTVVESTQHTITLGSQEGHTDRLTRPSCSLQSRLSRL